jgi:hypothetical protein
MGRHEPGARMHAKAIEITPKKFTADDQSSEKYSS